MFAHTADKKVFVLICRDDGHRLRLFATMVRNGINHQPHTELSFSVCNIKREV